MKQIRTWWKGAAAAAVFLLSAMAFSLVSFAQTGTLTVKMEYRSGEGEQATVENLTTGSLKAYKVMNVSPQDYRFTGLAEGFEKFHSEVTEDQLEQEETMEELAKGLLSYAEEQNLGPAAKAAVADGKAVLTLPEDGIYLVAQDEVTRGYGRITAFLIRLPGLNQEKKEYQWAIEANAKIAPNRCRIDPPIKKIVRQDSVTGTEVTDNNDPFTFVMKPTPADAPMPESSTPNADGSISMTQFGGGKYEFGWVYYDLADVGKTYTYELYEQKGDLDYEYATNRYTVKVVIGTDDDGNVIATKTCIGSDGREVDTTGWDGNGTVKERATFTNVIPKKPDPTPDPKPDPDSKPDPDPSLDPDPKPTPDPTPGPSPDPQPAPNPVPTPDDSPDPITLVSNITPDTSNTPDSSDYERSVLGAVRGAEGDAQTPGVLGAGRLPKMGAQQKKILLGILGLILVTLLGASAALKKKKSE